MENFYYILTEDIDTNQATNTLLNLAFCYYKSQNYEKAFTWLYHLSCIGNVTALYHTGLMYEKGQGVEKNPKQAVRFYSMAGIRGHVESQVLLGTYYFHGKFVSCNYKKAHYWFHMASSHPEAQFYIGHMYEKGIYLQQDIAKAKIWYLLSARQGHLKSQYNLGVLLKSSDVEESKYWTRVALTGGVLSEFQQILGSGSENIQLPDTKLTSRKRKRPYVKCKEFKIQEPGKIIIPYNEDNEKQIKDLVYIFFIVYNIPKSVIQNFIKIYSDQ